MFNMDRKQNTLRGISSLKQKQRKCRTPSIDLNTFQSRKKYTINDTSLKKNSAMSRKNVSLPKYLTNNQTIHRHKFANFKTLQERKSNNISKLNCQKVQIDLNTIMDNNGKSLYQTLSDGIKIFKSHDILNALKKFQLIESYVLGLSFKNMIWLAKCHYQLKNYNDTIRYLNQMVQKGVKLQENSYRSLYESYKFTNNLLCAIKTLDLLIQQAYGSAFYYLQRARLYVKIKNYDHAFKDYNKSLELDRTNIQTQIQRVDILHKFKGLQKSIKCYNEMLLDIHKQDDRSYIIYRKGLLLLQQKQYRSSLKVFSILTANKCPQFQTEINYYKGVIQTLLGNTQSALLYYEQAIISQTSIKFINQSFYQKIVLLLKMKNFYQASHDLSRIKTWNDQLLKLKQFIEGIINILKMNLKKGLAQLSQITPIKCFEALYHSFRSYAYYSLRQYKQALVQLNLIEGKLCQANIINKLTLEAILYLKNNNLKKCIIVLDQAKKTQQNVYVLILKALSHIKLYCNQAILQNREILFQAQQLLIKAGYMDLENDTIPYLSAIVNFELQDYQTGLDYIRTAIQLSEEHMIKHYFAKSHFKMSLNLYNDALNQLNNALTVYQQHLNSQNHEESPQKFILEIYLYRAICYANLNNRTHALEDLNTFFNKATSISQYESFFNYFLLVGAPDPILALLDDHYKNDKKMIIFRIKCLFMTKELNQCLALMKQFCESQDNNQIQYDWYCLNALKQASVGERSHLQDALSTFLQIINLSQQQQAEGLIFKYSDCLFYAGMLLFKLNRYEQAYTFMLKSKKQKIRAKKLGELGQDYENQIAYQNKTYSLQQINYNIGICYLFNDQVQKAEQYLKKYPEILLAKQIQVSIDEISEFQSQVAKKEITPFPIQSRLCSIYGPLTLNGNLIRLSFCLPQVILPSKQYVKCDKLIKNVDLEDIPMKPSPPWVKKGAKGIIFTEKLNKQSIDLKSVKGQNEQMIKK